MTIFKMDHPRPIDRVIDFFGEAREAARPVPEPHQGRSAAAPDRAVAA